MVSNQKLASVAHFRADQKRQNECLFVVDAPLPHDLICILIFFLSQSSANPKTGYAMYSLAFTAASTLNDTSFNADVKTAPEILRFKDV